MSEEGFLPPLVAVLKGNISNFEAKMAEARGEMNKTGDSMASKAKHTGKAVALGLAAVAGVAIAVGVDSIKMADQFEASHARLSTMIHNTGGNITQFNSILKTNEDHFANLGYNSTEYEGALAMLVPAVGNTKAAIKDMSIAVDLAAARHIDLEKAAILVGKVASGNTTILKRYGIDLGLASGGALKTKNALIGLGKAEDNIKLVEEKIHDGRLKGANAADALRKAQQQLKDAQDKLTAAQSAGKDGLDALGKKMAGSASAQSETFAGKMKALHARLHNIQTRIGLWLIPKILDLEKAFIKVTQWWDKSGSPMMKKFFDWTYKLGHAIADFGHKFDGVFAAIGDKLMVFVGQMEKVGASIADVLNLGDHTMSQGDKDAMYAKQDKKEGLAPGTTKRKVESMPGYHALGGIANYPMSGGLAVLHGHEAILPLDNMPAANRIAREVGVGGGGGGHHFSGPISIMVVSPDPEQAGADVMNTLTDAGFMTERN